MKFGRLGPIAAALAIVLMQAALSNSAEAQIDGMAPAPPTDVIVNEAAKIAIVRIVDRKLEYDGRSADRSACGYTLTANVVEAFKGGNQSFQFFSPIAADFKGYDRDYFVIVFPKGEASPTAFSPPVDIQRPDLAASLRCLSKQELYTPVQFQSLWSFDSEASKEYGGEWLIGAHRPDGLLCGFDIRRVSGFRIRAVSGIQVQTQDDSTRYAINWTDVKRVVLTNLAKPYSLSKCGIE